MVYIALRRYADGDEEEVLKMSWPGLLNKLEQARCHDYHLEYTILKGIGHDYPKEDKMVIEKKAMKSVSHGELDQMRPAANANTLEIAELPQQHEESQQHLSLTSI
ncbi:Nn.00g031410.m01.CDS01 [Neocucurbitaria sp. VM-36]